jgi:hypothetical protein
VTLQFLALGLLQLAGIASYLNHIALSPGPSVVCRGDHRQCGCHPERIANGTCCCSRKGPACCVINKEQALAADHHHTEGNCSHSERAWRNVPCGGGAKYVGFSFSKIDLVMPELSRVAAVEPRHQAYFPHWEASPDDFLLTPPTPPPESLPHA